MDSALRGRDILDQGNASAPAVFRNATDIAYGTVNVDGDGSGRARIAEPQSIDRETERIGIDIAILRYSAGKNDGERHVQADPARNRNGPALHPDRPQREDQPDRAAADKNTVATLMRGAQGPGQSGAGFDGGQLSGQAIQQPFAAANAYSPTTCFLLM